LEGAIETQTEGHHLLPVASESQESRAPPEPLKVPSHTNPHIYQAKREWQAEKSYLKQMSEMQKQHLEKKKLEKLFNDSKKKALQLSLALSQRHLGDRFVAAEVTGSYYTIARGKGFDSFGIYTDVKKYD
jgi:hypothetical protein